MKPRMAKRYAAWLLAGVPLVCGADWRSQAHASAHAESGGRAAVVTNEDGYSISIFMSDATTLTATLSLPQGLEALDARGCPTLSVDDNLPERLHQPPGRCVADGLGARIRLAQVAQGAVDSQVLLQLLNGEALTVRIRLRSAGYRQTRFTLKGSKQALKSALPSGTLVVGD